MGHGRGPGGGLHGTGLLGAGVKVHASGSYRTP